MWTFIICVTSTASQRNISPKNDHLPSFTEQYIFSKWYYFLLLNIKIIIRQNIQASVFCTKKITRLFAQKKNHKISVLQPLLWSDLHIIHYMTLPQCYFNITKILLYLCICKYVYDPEYIYHRYVCSNIQQYIVWVKMIDLYFYAKNH